MIKKTPVDASSPANRTVSVIPSRIIPAQHDNDDIANDLSEVRKHRTPKPMFLASIKIKNAVPISPTLNSISNKPLWAWGENQRSDSPISIAAGLSGDQTPHSPIRTIAFGRYPV